MNLDAWFETDQAKDVLTSLEQVSMSLRRIQSDDLAHWKWAVLSFHNALQGAFVCCLSGTANIGALDKKTAKAWLEWMALHPGDRGPFPNTRLASPLDLHKRLYKQRCRIERDPAESVSQAAAATRHQFKLLNTKRTEFAHFEPSSYLMYVGEFTTWFEPLIGLLRAIQEEGWAFRHLDDETSDKLFAELALVGDLNSDL